MSKLHCHLAVPLAYQLSLLTVGENLTFGTDLEGVGVLKKCVTVNTDQIPHLLHLV